MGNFTFEEMNLMCIYNTGSRTGLIDSLREMRGELSPEETELRELTDSALCKLQTMTDDEFAELDIPLPNYLSTTVKHDLLDGEIVMSWADKNVIVFSETISEKDAAICAKKGWHPFELFAMEPGKLKEAIG